MDLKATDSKGNMDTVDALMFSNEPDAFFDFFSMNETPTATAATTAFHGQQMSSQSATTIKDEPTGDSKTGISLTPPKKAISPYMRFSKEMWPQVKSAHPEFNICELGAKMGEIWRSMSEEQKKPYNNQYENDKIRYEIETKEYFQKTGLTAKDLAKPRNKKPVFKNVHSHHSNNTTAASKSNQEELHMLKKSIAEKEKEIKRMEKTLADILKKIEHAREESNCYKVKIGQMYQTMSPVATTTTVRTQ